MVPVVLWGRKPPTHCIAAILMTPDQRNIITGCNDGQIGIWDVTENSQVHKNHEYFLVKDVDTMNYDIDIVT